MRRKNTVEDFWKLVEKGEENDCWYWQGKKRLPYGYGSFSLLGQKSAHRCSYVIHKGPIRKGFFICHKCNHPSCVNPKHLYQGTYAENAYDRNQRYKTGELKHKAKRLRPAENRR